MVNRTLGILVLSLAEYLLQVKADLPRKESNGFVEPSAADRATFTNCIQALLNDKVEPARTCLDGVNYDLQTLTEAGRTYLIASERKQNFKGLGTYIVALKYQRNFVLEVPHPIYDSGTLEEAGMLLQKTGARALFVTGTHRCANAGTASGCDGRTAACGSDAPYCISDAAHAVNNFYTAAHQATLTLKPQPVAISVHGSAGEPVDAELSDGTSLPARANSLVIRLRNALVANGVKAGSCNWAADDPARFKLCGGTNVQGRLSNGVAAACTEAAKKSSGMFIHIEQRRNLRDNPAGLLQALLDVFPASN